MNIFLANLCILSVVHIVLCEISKINFDNNKWTVQSQNKTITAPANVPGGIYSDLRKANVLKEDIFYRFNDLAYRWVSKTGWYYSTEFEVTDKNFLSKNNQVLVFHGIDTIASIYLNDKLIGTTNNMFVRYRFDVKDKLLSKNRLSVFIASPIIAANKTSSELPHPSPPDCTPSSYKGECHVNVLRKMQSSFAWDWGPAFPSVGIWKSIELEGYHTAQIRDVLTTIVYHSDLESWSVDIAVILETGFTSPKDSVKMKLTSEITLPKRSISHDSVFTSYNLSTDGEVELKSNLVVPANEVKLWWPNGYGDQYLYDLEVTLASGSELVSKTVKIGFRTIELIQKPVDPKSPEKGNYFYFEVNKVPIYSKGSNLIPVDVLPEHAYNEKTIRNLLLSTKEANMNMLRVWGGGVYMSDYFYEQCDELGILIWQDMMFACNTYPTTSPFLSSVTTEIVQNVRRLQHHPSIAIWAGNNEMEAAMRGNWYTYMNEDLYFKEYEELYYTLMKPIFDKYDPSRSYLTSSPTNGLLSDNATYHIAADPYSPLYGDSHNYNYRNDLWDPKNAPNTRFCSEYGLQSLPQMSTLRKIAKDEDLTSLETKFFESRQHLSGGNNILEDIMNKQFNADKKISMEYFVYLSQVYQAQAIKTITEKMRRDKGVLRKDGSGANMGALYWQLNDVWQAPTWSSVDYEGNWKMLHFFARKFFSPILVSPYWNNNSNAVDVVLINDRRDKLNDMTVLVEAFAWNSTLPNKTFSAELKTVENNSVKTVLSVPVNKIFTNDDEKEQYFIQVSVRSKANSSPTVEPNYLFLAPIKNSEKYMKSPEIIMTDVTMKSSPNGVKEFNITLNTDFVSLFTWVTISGVSGKLSDNGFVFIGKKTFTFVTNDEKASIDYIKNHVQIMNIQKTPRDRHAVPVQFSSADLPSRQWSIVIAAFIFLYYFV